jgi:hypothetical protein
VTACHVWPCFRTPRGLLGSMLVLSRFTLVSSLITMSRRLYLGSMCASLSQLPLSSSSPLLAELPPDTRSDDVSKFFDGHGKIIDCRVMTGQSQSYFTP